MLAPNQVVSFLRPAALVALAFAAWMGACFLRSGPAELDVDFLAPGAVTAEHLPDLGADQVDLPKPALSPDEVVQIQLDGLADPDADGLGILRCFCFASPRNRAATGPLDRFGQMVRQGPFACLARPQATLVGEPQVDGRFAKILVTVVDERQQMQAFTFILFKQQAAPFVDCWMTEAVYPLGGLAPAATADGNPRPNAA